MKHQQKISLKDRLLELINLIKEEHLYFLAFIACTIFLIEHFGIIVGIISSIIIFYYTKYDIEVFAFRAYIVFILFLIGLFGIIGLIIGMILYIIIKKRENISKYFRDANDQTKIQWKATSNNIKGRRKAVDILRSNFSILPDKILAWDDLHRLTQDKISSVRKDAAEALGSVFSDIPDKIQAWDDLHRLTQDKISSVRRAAAGALVVAFSDIPDKIQAWDDLERLTQDEDSDVRRSAAFNFGDYFFQFPNKILAWSILHRMTQDEDSRVRYYAAFAFYFGNIFPDIPDKIQAWDDLGAQQKHLKKSFLTSLIKYRHGMSYKG
jgi:hypothetical protein